MGGQYIPGWSGLEKHRGNMLHIDQDRDRRLSWPRALNPGLVSGLFRYFQNMD